MKKITIAIGSNNGENIVKTHMGEAKYFYIYKLAEDGTFRFIDKRRNTSPEEEGEHGASEKMKAVTHILKDSDVIIGKKISPNFRKIAAKTSLQPVVIKIDEIPEIMNKVEEFFDEIFCLVEQRRNSKRPKEIPVLEKKT